MFKFNFAQTLDYPLDMEDDEEMQMTIQEEADEGVEQDEEEEIAYAIEKIELPPDEEELATPQTACEEITLEDLIKTLSSVISFTPLVVGPLSSNSSKPIILPRRDLYDARFQIISEDTISESESEWDTEEEEVSELNDDEVQMGEDSTEPEQITFPSRDSNMESVSPEQEENPPKPSPEQQDPKPPRKTRRVRSKTPPPLPPKTRTARRSSQPRSERLSRIKELAYIDAPSDVIPNIYEGGLKMWECSVDVVEYLTGLTDFFSSFRGLNVLEVGCGTAVPSAFILQSILNEPLDDESSTETKPCTLIHLQDYNRSVLELVTLPNIILAWYSSNAAAQYRQSLPPEPPSPTSRSSTPRIIEEEEETGEDQLTPSGAEAAVGKEDTTSRKEVEKPGDLDITPQMLTAFHQSLSQHNIELRFSAGSWESFDPRSQTDISGPDRGKSEGVNLTRGTDPPSDVAPPYDLIITSETIYRTSNVPSLLSVLRNASTNHVGSDKPVLRSPTILSSLTRQWHLPTPPSPPDYHGDWEEQPSNITETRSSTRTSMVLVAAKILYLGVGGSIIEFESIARGDGARVETVWERNVGVGRKILRLSWS
ncbi:hypothetical protein FRC18_005809 [Serendipita sp. 400]|nr:hypothetical protein FRC18_005809 [Serendipita sp. 400]